MSNHKKWFGLIAKTRPVIAEIYDPPLKFGGESRDGWVFSSGCIPVNQSTPSTQSIKAAFFAWKATPEQIAITTDLMNKNRFIYRYYSSWQEVCVAHQIDLD